MGARTSSTRSARTVAQARRQAGRALPSSGTISKYFSRPASKTKLALIASPPPSPPSNTLILDETTRAALKRIASHPSLTPYRRRVYRTLLSVPSGRWTTYAVLSAHLSSSARAIGNAMRTNPFAPDVPCHRVLATDRTIGGYKGAWGTGGSYAEEKTKLLCGEGVVFDERGRAGGEVFTEFVDLGLVESDT